MPMPLSSNPFSESRALRESEREREGEREREKKKNERERERDRFQEGIDGSWDPYAFPEVIPVVPKDSMSSLTGSLVPSVTGASNGAL